jgi:transcriptional regulator with XRE-family HTH domain
MTMHILSDRFTEIIRREHQVFAMKMRVTRALLGWSQSELAFRIGLTQRAVHKLEQGDTEPRRATVHAVEHVWLEQHIKFVDLADGGFQVNVGSSLTDRPVTARSKRHRDAHLQLGVTSLAPYRSAYRA